MALSILDYVLIGLAAVLAILGLFRGISGEIGRAAGLAAGLAAGFLGFAFCCALVVQVPGLAGHALLAGVVLDLLLAFLAFFLVSKIVRKFVSIVIPQPFNAIFGACVGAAKAGVVVVLLAFTGLLFGASCAEGPLAGYSVVVREAGVLLDAYMGNAAS